MLGTLAVIAFLSIVGCGNNGGGGAPATTGTTGTGGGPGGTPTSAPARLEVFRASLLAIDPADPTTIIDLDPLASDLGESPVPVGALPVVAGTWIDGAILNGRVEEVLYSRTNGRLARVSTDASSGTPTPRVVSSQALPQPVCDAQTGPDLADFENTRFLFAETADEACSAPLTYWSVTLSDDEETAPRPFPGTPVTFLVDRATGAHTGWLAVDEGGLIRVDADLNVTAPSLRSGSERGAALGVTRDGLVFVEIDQSLFTFDPETDTLSDELFAFASPCPCNAAFATDGTFAFASADNELFRIDPISGDVISLDAPANGVRQLGFFLLPTFVLVGETRVAWSYVADEDGLFETFDDQGVVWRSVAKDGADAFEFEAVDPFELQSFAFLPLVPTIVGDRLFYNSVVVERTPVDVARGLEPAPPAASIEITFEIPGSELYLEGAPTGEGPIPSEGPAPGPIESIRARAIHRDLAPGATPEILEDALWVGSSIPSAFTVFGGGASRVQRITELPDLRSLENNPNAIPFESVDATNPSAPETRLGMLDAGTFYALSLPGIGPERIGIAFAPDDDSDFQSEILYWNDEETDSLVRVTETETVDEFPVPFF